MDWQTPAALAIVVLTTIIFFVKLRRGKKSCGGGCACPKDTRKEKGTSS